MSNGAHRQKIVSRQIGSGGNPNDMLVVFGLAIGGIPIGILISRLMRGKPASIELGAGLVAVAVALVAAYVTYH